MSSSRGAKLSVSPLPNPMRPRNKERSPAADDKSGGAIATSEQVFSYAMRGDFASAWLRLGVKILTRKQHD